MAGADSGVESVHYVVAKNIVKFQLAALAMALAVAAPARAHNVLCDGNLICQAVVVPILSGKVAFDELHKRAADRADQYIRQRKHMQLRKAIRNDSNLTSDRHKGPALLWTAAAAGNLDAAQILVKAGVAPHANQLEQAGADSPDASAGQALAQCRAQLAAPCPPVQSVEPPAPIPAPVPN